jgi:hypothetical protein
MKTVKKIITIDKKQHTVELSQYEDFNELMLTVSATEILEAYNFRVLQLQVMDEKKRLKPRHIPIKEKRKLAFNLFSEAELAETTQDAGKFEGTMDKKLVIIEQKIKDKEII